MAVRYKRILLPLDGSDFAAKALPHAEGIARSMGAELILLQVIPAGDVPMTDPAISPVDAESMDLYVDQQQFGQMQSVLVENARQSLLKIAEISIGEGIDVRPAVEIGSPAAVIVDYAQSHDVDLIVMSTHGRTGVSRWVFGSVATKLLRAAICPVLMVRAGN